MSKSRINILIVEDDPTQGKALYEAFTREGYSAYLCNTSVQALTQAQRMEFHGLMVDCMLPRMNGVDLVQEILGMLPNKPKVFLFTGIFKDRKFMREAMDKTGAETFFLKPLNLTEVLTHVAEAFVDLSVQGTPSYLKLYAAAPFTNQDLAKMIDLEPTIHAFHLPMLYQRIHYTTLTGSLTLISPMGDVSSVSFFQGRVCSVKTPDKDSYFGSLAVSAGFVSPDEVLDALKDPSGKMLGEKLIESMSLSPHAIQVILEEQLALRLSQTVQDEVISLQWLNLKLPKPPHSLNDAKFEHLVNDWLESKITQDWIKSTLMAWGQFSIEGDFHARIRGTQSIEAVFSDDHFREDSDLVPVFRALIQGKAFIGERGEPVQDFTFLSSRLDQMASDFKHQNYFQLLGLSEKAQTREVSKAYEGLKEAFDPTRLPEGCPNELTEKCVSVFALIEKAHLVLMDDIARMRYLQDLHSKHGQKMLEAEPIFRTAVLEVMSGHAKEASIKFQGLIDQKLEFKDLRAYRIWAGLKSDRTYADIRLDHIPPEERHSSAYMMAKGISYRIRGHYKKALEAFRTAHVLDPRLRIAKEELKQLIAEIERQKGNNRDLIREVTTTVENLFGKAKRGA